MPTAGVANVLIFERLKCPYFSDNNSVRGWWKADIHQIGTCYDRILAITMWLQAARDLYLLRPATNGSADENIVDRPL